LTGFAGARTVPAAFGTVDGSKDRIPQLDRQPLVRRRFGSRRATLRQRERIWGDPGLRNTNLPLLKFSCDNRECLFECYVNQNNNLLTHYNPNMSALLDWPCPECKTGFLRFSANNTQFEFTLHKEEKVEEAERS
jgi:hypothetical protein